MNTKVVAVVLGGIVAVAALAFLLSGSPDAGDEMVGSSAPEGLASPDDPMDDPRFASRPKVLDVKPDSRPRDEKTERTSDVVDSDGLEGGVRKPGRLGSETTGAEGRRHGADVPSRLEDSSLPFERSESGDGGAAARRPLGDSRHGEPPDLVDAIEDPLAEDDEDQPVLSLFDGEDAAADIAEASVEKNVNLDEDGARFSLDSELAIPMAGRITGDAGSISFWVRPEGDTADLGNASLVQLRSHYQFNDRLQIWKDGGSVRLVFADSNGQESGVMYVSDAWPSGEWRLVTTTWGNGENALYVNGLLAGKSQFEGEFNIRPDTLLHIGSNYSEDPRSLQGTVSQFHVFDRELDPEEISALPSEYPE